MRNQRILGHFNESADLKKRAADVLAEPIANAADLMFSVLTQGNKILACGNGGSAADCQHFAAELVGRFEKERLPLPAMALTTDTSILTAVGNDYSYQDVFVKQVQAFGQPGDLLLAISTSGNSSNVVSAIEAAHDREMSVIALTGKGGGAIGKMLAETDQSSRCRIGGMARTVSASFPRNSRCNHPRPLLSRQCSRMDPGSGRAGS